MRAVERLRNGGVPRYPVFLMPATHCNKEESHPQVSESHTHTHNGASDPAHATAKPLTYPRPPIARISPDAARRAWTEARSTHLSKWHEVYSLARVALCQAALLPPAPLTGSPSPSLRARARLARLRHPVHAPAPLRRPRSPARPTTDQLLFPLCQAATLLSMMEQADLPLRRAPEARGGACTLATHLAAWV